jgi:hypothetical protein
MGSPSALPAGRREQMLRAAAPMPTSALNARRDLLAGLDCAYQGTCRCNGWAARQPQAAHRGASRGSWRSSCGWRMPGSKRQAADVSSTSRAEGTFPPYGPAATGQARRAGRRLLRRSARTAARLRVAVYGEYAAARVRRSYISFATAGDCAHYLRRRRLGPLRCIDGVRDHIQTATRSDADPAGLPSARRPRCARLQATSAQYLDKTNTLRYMTFINHVTARPRLQSGVQCILAELNPEVRCLPGRRAAIKRTSRVPGTLVSSRPL